MCNKKRYDKLGAQLMLSSCLWKSNFKADRQEIRIYYCNICKAYHLTKQHKLWK